MLETNWRLNTSRYIMPQNRIYKLRLWICTSISWIQETSFSVMGIINTSTHRYHPHYTKHFLTNNTSTPVLHPGCHIYLRVCSTCVSVFIPTASADYDEDWLTRQCLERIAQSSLFSLWPLFSQSGLFPFTLIVFALFSCSVCQTSVLHSPSSLKPAPW